MDFNSAIEELNKCSLTEAAAYTPVTGLTDAEKATAKDLFDQAVKAGYIDIENFHKAFDDGIVADGLVDVFGADGYLIGSYIYPKVRDVKTLSGRACKKLWVYQFAKDASQKLVKSKAEFDNIKAKEQAKLDAEKKAAEEKKLRLANVKAKAEKANRLLDKLGDNPEYEDLLGRYEEAVGSKAKMKIDVGNVQEDTVYVNIIDPKANDGRCIQRAVTISENDDPMDIIDRVMDRVTSALEQDIITAKQRAEAEHAADVKKEKLAQQHLEFLLNSEFKYELKDMSTGKLVPELMWKDECLDEKYKIIAAYKTTSSTGRCYYDYKGYYSIISDLTTLDELKLDLTKNGPFGSITKVVDPDPSDNRYVNKPPFDLFVFDEDECDSGD